MATIRKQVSRGIIQCKGLYLLCFSKTSGNYFLPGGTIEPNEDAICALRRELLEECGLELADITLVGSLENTYTATDNEIQEQNFVFRAGLQHELGEILAYEDYLSFHWISPAGVDNIRLMPPAMKKFLYTV